jgi:two-component sensor histidine kinase
MILRTLIELGVKDDLDFYQKREIRIVNLFALVIISGLIIGGTSVLFLGGAYPVATVSFTALSSLLILLLNARRLYNLATYVFVISINFTIFLINQNYDVSVACYLYYFPVIFCVALIHNPHKPNYRTIVFFTITLFSFFAARFLNIAILKNTTVSAEDNEVLLLYNSWLTVVLTVFLVYLVVKLINRQNNEVIASSEKEHEAKAGVSASLKEKEILLAEIQHRVKNNLAVISGLLSLQIENAQSDETRNFLLDAKNRVMSIAMVHERLYKKDNLSKINFSLYLSELVQEVVKGFPLHSQVEIIKELDAVEIPITKAVPVGLIVNEAVTNSLKHAFKQKVDAPKIKIQMKVIFESLQISISDNGSGFLNLQDRKETSLGITLIESLADQIDAKLAFRNDNGAYINLVFSA